MCLCNNLSGSLQGPAASGNLRRKRAGRETGDRRVLDRFWLCWDFHRPPDPWRREALLRRDHECPAWARCLRCWAQRHLEKFATTETLQHDGAMMLQDGLVFFYPSSSVDPPRLPLRICVLVFEPLRAKASDLAPHIYNKLSGSFGIVRQLLQESLSRVVDCPHPSLLCLHSLAFQAPRFAVPCSVRLVPCMANQTPQLRWLRQS